MKYDIITFGSVSQDIFIKSSAFEILREEKDGQIIRKVCLPFGSKIQIEDIVFTSGGGGSNTAATFAKQGFKVAFLGAIGVDAAGLEIIRELKELKISTRFLIKKKSAKTNHSIVISPQGRERTILVYRGASELITKEDIPWRKIKKTNWFYLAPLTGLLCDSFEEIVNFGYENNIKIAANPSLNQLSLPSHQLERILQKIDILFLNREEASFFTKIPQERESEILKELKKKCRGIIVVTKGEEGVMVFDGEHLYTAQPPQERNVIDPTGAGDSFAAGFLSNYIKKNGDIEEAIQLGMANATANLSQIGAKTGLLDKDSTYQKIEIKKQVLI